MADRVSDYWVAFARSGDPNMARAPRWPRFAIGQDYLMEFSNRGSRAIRDFGAVRMEMLRQAAGR
jgi:para-nitrobenzyl esterase